MRFQRFSPLLALSAITLGLVEAPATADLLINGNFEAGNTGFTSDYPYLQQTFGYQIVHNPHIDWYGGFASFGDHTTGTGLMLAVDGATTPGKVVWQETINVSTSQLYSFSGWAASMGGASVDPNPAVLNFYVNNVLFGTFRVPAVTGVWTPFSSSVTVLSGPVTLKIIDTTVAGIGNDFALDDLSFAAVPEPPSLMHYGIGGLMISILLVLRQRTKAVACQT